MERPTLSGRASAPCSSERFQNHIERDRPFKLMVVHECREAAEVDKAARDRSVGVNVAAFEDFAQVVQRLQDRALARTVLDQTAA